MNKEKKEAYTDFASQVSASVSKVICDGDSLLWVILPQGVARSAAKPDLDNLLSPNLQDKTQWIFYGATFLPSATVNDIIYHKGSVWAATSGGLAEYTSGTWIDHGHAGSANLYSLAPDGTGLLVGTSDRGVYTYDGAAWDSLSSSGLQNRHITALARDADGVVWAGTRWESPHYFSSTDNRWYQVNLRPYGPYSDYVFSSAIENDSVVWFGGKGNNAINRFNTSSGIWELFGYSGGSWLRNIRIDRDNNKWFCTWDKGLVKIDSNDSVTILNSTNTVLTDFDPGATNVPDVAFRPDGKMYIANWYNEVFLYDPSVDTMTIFPRDSLSGDQLQFTELAMDNDGRFWIGTGHYGELGGEFYSGTTSLGLFNDEYELPHNYVREIMPDHLGRVWIATSYGISMYEDGTWVYNASNPILKGYIVNDIDYDSSGNIWAATDGYGVFQFSGEGQQLAHYTAGGTGLVNDVVQSVRVNRRTGDVWMGTIHGISRYASAFGAPPVSLDLITAYPNPFKPGEGHDYLTFDQIIPGAQIRIYTFAGEKVITLPGRPELGKVVRWDGRNADGDPVASGMYYFNVYHAETGNAATGKFAVIR